MISQLESFSTQTGTGWELTWEWTGAGKGNGREGAENAIRFLIIVETILTVALALFCRNCRRNVEDLDSA
jgi:hypothetical protein